MHIRLAAAIVASVVLLGAAPAWADADKEGEKWVPPGLSKEERAEWKGGRPPGWSRGAKRGWGGRDCPPGLAKKGRCGDARTATASRPKAGEDAVRDAIERLKKWGREKLKLPPATLDAVLVGFEGAVRQGVPIPAAERVAMAAAERGVSAYGIEALTRALAYGAQRGAPAVELEAFAMQGLQRDVAADALALGLYRLAADATR